MSCATARKRHFINRSNVAPRQARVSRQAAYQVLKEYLTIHAGDARKLALAGDHGAAAHCQADAGKGFRGEGTATIDRATLDEHAGLDSDDCVLGEPEATAAGRTCALRHASRKVGARHHDGSFISAHAAHEDSAAFG